MKKTIYLLAIILGGITLSNAQVTFKPGIRAGANFSRLRQNHNLNEKYSAITDFYIAGFGELKVSKFYALQPEIGYSREGSKKDYIASVYNPNTSSYVSQNQTAEFNVQYLTTNVMNKFFIKKAYLLIGPSLDINITPEKKNYSGSNGYYLYDPAYNYNYNNYSDYSSIDIGFVGGFGIDLTKNIGVEARIKKGVVDVYDGQDAITYQLGVTAKF
jgi:hypothetical protein